MTKQRCKYWPEDFSSKKYVLVFRKNKETSYKIENKDEVWRYAVAAGRYQLHGTEGSGLETVKNGSWTADKELVLGDEALVQEDSSLKFNGVIQEDMEGIKAGLIRTMKRKIRKRSPLSLTPAGPKTRSGVVNSAKPKRPTKSTSILLAAGLPLKNFKLATYSTMSHVQDVPARFSAPAFLSVNDNLQELHAGKKNLEKMLVIKDDPQTSHAKMKGIGVCKIPSEEG